MYEYKRIKEVFGDKGIFSYLREYGEPWSGKVTADMLDLMYIGKSGNKITAPILDNMMEEDGTISEENKKKVASAIWGVYGTNWTKLFETLNFNYNPIENYSMVEESSGENENITNGTSSNETSNNGTSTVENTSTQDTNNDLYAFNSTTSKPSSKSSGVGTDHNTVTTDNKTGNQTTLNNISKDTSKHTLTRKGNIGVTTSQQMIQSERDLWNWVFYNGVFRDIDSILTLSIY